MCDNKNVESALCVIHLGHNIGNYIAADDFDLGPGFFFSS